MKSNPTSMRIAVGFVVYSHLSILMLTMTDLVSTTFA